MSTLATPCLLAALAIAPGIARAAAPAAIEQAGILHGALVAGPVGTPPTTLAGGGYGRDLPAFSPDGTRIAFVQGTDKHRALADIVVVGRNGTELSRTPVQPVEPGLAYTGMQYVEALRWISPSRILIRGSIDPAQSQYYLVDAEHGRIVGDFTDDDSAAAVSPDGTRIVTLSGSPPYAPRAGQQPELALNDRPFWRGEPGTTLAAHPRFLPDGASLAWATRDPAGHATLWFAAAGAPRRVATPAAPDATLAIAWSGDKPVLRAALPDRTLAWSPDASGRAAVPVVVQDPLAPALAWRTDLARRSGLTEPDFWCADCALAQLPRGNE